MNKKPLVLVFLTCILLLSSCIKEQPANIDADLIEVQFPDESGVMHVSYTSSIVEVYVRSSVDPNNFGLDIIVSEGATVSPNPTEVTDYSKNREFTITSENGEWSKKYTISLVYNNIPLKYDFENWLNPPSTKYLVPYEVDIAGNELNMWACGNAAFAFMAGGKDYTAYPTQPSDNFVQKGKRAVLLKTQHVGIGNRHLASGNLFIGQFDASKFDPLQCTKFGQPFMARPLRLKGWYKYRSAGTTTVTKIEDECNIQAVMYKTDENLKFLDGYTIKTSPSIVARAQLQDCSSTKGEDYIPFDIEFTYTQEIDTDLLLKGGYNLTVMFVSSRNGSTFDGAVGSELYVDDVEIICE